MGGPSARDHPSEETEEQAQAAIIEVEEDDEEGDDEGQGEPITQRTPVGEEEEDVEEEADEKSLWAKLTTFVQGTEYEQFIQEMGQELKELFTEYLSEYFEDLEKGEGEVILRAKYESFIDAYYKKAIAKDKELIEKIKGE